MKLVELYEFILEKNLDRYVIEWAGIFRYLNSTKPSGFTMEEWRKLCSVNFDKIIIETIFRLLLECNLIMEQKSSYIIVEELELQRNFESLKFMIDINNNSSNNFKQELLWTKASSINVPKYIGNKFSYLSIYLSKLICSAKDRVILFSPYYSSEGVEQLVPSLKYLLGNDNNIKVDVIINDTENKINKKAVNTLSRVLNYPDTNNYVRILKANIKAEDIGLFFHAKLLLVDGERGYMGSANFSRRALTEQLEIGVKLSKDNTKNLENLIDYLIVEDFFVEI